MLIAGHFYFLNVPGSPHCQAEQWGPACGGWSGGSDCVRPWPLINLWHDITRWLLPCHLPAPSLTCGNEVYLTVRDRQQHYPLVWGLSSDVQRICLSSFTAWDLMKARSVLNQIAARYNWQLVTFSNEAIPTLTVMTESCQATVTDIWQASLSNVLKILTEINCDDFVKPSPDLPPTFCCPSLGWWISRQGLCRL